MISTNQFKNGSHIEIDGKVFKIVEFQHVKPGKGGAFVRTKLRKIEDGVGARQNLPGRREVQAGPHRVAQDAVPLRLRRRRGLHGHPRLRADRDLDRDVVGESMQWLLPNAEVDILFVDESPSDVQLPSAVDMKVTPTEPGVKGDTASGGGSKAATLESGVAVQVPLFIEEGETDPDRHPQRRVRVARVRRDMVSCADPTNVATRSSPAISAM